MKKVVIGLSVLVMSLFMSCAIFVNDDDECDHRKNDSSKDTITIIHSQLKGNPVSAH